MPDFKHFDLRIVQPSFSDELTDIIIDLEKLRNPKKKKGKVDEVIFLQLKTIFHTLESLGSIKIEGNNTTISDIVDKTIDGTIKTSKEEKIKEFNNTQNALQFIEDHIGLGVKIDRVLISELHKLVVKDLDPGKEGDTNPGCYREVQRVIANSKHVLPSPSQVGPYMEEFIKFINDTKIPKYQLIIAALAHHRFSWVHPFFNGNGRTVRLITYAMLVSQGFAVNRVLNPTAVFCNDRNKYYEMLARADEGTDEALLDWCRYVLVNLLEEIKKIDKLQDYDFLTKKILLPTIDQALRTKNIGPVEHSILSKAIEKQSITPQEINKILNKKYSSQVSLYISKLKKEGLIMNHPNKRFNYVIAFDSSYLLRGVIDALRNEGFIPESEF